MWRLVTVAIQIVLLTAKEVRRLKYYVVVLLVMLPVLPPVTVTCRPTDKRKFDWWYKLYYWKPLELNKQVNENLQ